MLLSNATAVVALPILPITGERTCMIIVSLVHRIMTNNTYLCVIYSYLLNKWYTM